MTKKLKPGFIIFPVILLMAGIVTLLLLFVFVFQPVKISGQAMNPNFTHGEYYLVNKITPKVMGLKHSDVVMFKAPPAAQCPVGTGCTFISRVIAVPGDTITINNDQVWRNDQLLEENYIRVNQTQAGKNLLEEGETYHVPSDQYVVLGDNRSHSADSRRFGPITQENIVGTLAFCYANCSN